MKTDARKVKNQTRTCENRNVKRDLHTKKRCCLHSCCSYACSDVHDGWSLLLCVVVVTSVHEKATAHKHFLFHFRCITSMLLHLFKKKKRYRPFSCCWMDTRTVPPNTHSLAYWCLCSSYCMQRVVLSFFDVFLFGFLSYFSDFILIFFCRLSKRKDMETHINSADGVI